MKPTLSYRLTSVLFATLALIVSHGALAQSKQSVAYSLPHGSSRFLQEHVIEVGDVPGHKLRVFESRVDYQNVNLSFGGVKVKESFTRGASDYINGNGAASNYAVYMMEDGNRIFAKESGVGQVTENADGTVALKYAVVATFTGGTGKFHGIKGTLLGNVVRMPGENTIRADVAGEYWLEE